MPRGEEASTPLGDTVALLGCPRQCSALDNPPWLMEVPCRREPPPPWHLFWQEIPAAVLCSGDYSLSHISAFEGQLPCIKFTEVELGSHSSLSLPRSGGQPDGKSSNDRNLAQLHVQDSGV